VTDIGEAGVGGFEGFDGLDTPISGLKLSGSE
jgi:hypothetical protein